MFRMSSLLNLGQKFVSNTDIFLKFNAVTPRSSRIMIKTPRGTSFEAIYNQSWEDLGVLNEMGVIMQEAAFHDAYPNAIK